jgi:hypothetical protein
MEDYARDNVHEKGREFERALEVAIQPVIVVLRKIPRYA